MINSPTKIFYIAILNAMKLKILELQNNNINKKKPKAIAILLMNQKDVKQVFYYTKWFYIFEIICFKLISY